MNRMMRGSSPQKLSGMYFSCVHATEPAIDDELKIALVVLVPETYYYARLL